MNAKHTAKKLLGYLVSGYRLNELVCACSMCRVTVVCAVHVCASLFVQVQMPVCFAAVKGWSSLQV